MPQNSMTSFMDDPYEFKLLAIAQTTPHVIKMTPCRPSCFSLKEGVVVSALCVPLNLLPRLCKQKLPSPSRRAPLNANTSSRQMPADTTESNGAFLLSYSEQLTSKEGRSTMCSQSDLLWDESSAIPLHHSFPGMSI